MGFETSALEFVAARAFDEVALKVAVALEVGIGLELGLEFGLDLEPERIASVSFVGLQGAPVHRHTKNESLSLKTMKNCIHELSTLINRKSRCQS